MIITTISTVTSTSTSTSTITATAGVFGVLAILLLIALLVIKELSQDSEAVWQKILARSLDVGIAPLSVLFLMTALVATLAVIR